MTLNPVRLSGPRLSGLQLTAAAAWLQHDWKPFREMMVVRVSNLYIQLFLLAAVLLGNEHYWAMVRK